LRRPRAAIRELEMANPLVREQTTAEFFRELVESAMARQHVKAADLTEFYLVNLLCQHVRIDGIDRRGEHAQPLALRLARAIESAGSEQRARLRSIGDFSVFMAGFFSDSFKRAAVDIDYYKSMGEYAYGSLSRSDDDRFAEVFGELSRKFVGFVDVLADISEHTTLAKATDVLRLYERWLRTGSERDGQRLIERGILPNQSIGKRFVQ
jgi:hypothetical protein